MNTYVYICSYYDEVPWSTPMVVSAVRQTLEAVMEESLCKYVEH